MIPETAVEAAARAHYGASDPSRWGSLAPMVRGIHLKKMRRALEAASPYMLAGAWDAGCWQGYREGSDYDLALPAVANPYRTAQ